MNLSRLQLFEILQHKIGIPDKTLKRIPDVVCDDPEIGELKVGDLAGIRVHKFRFSRQEYLIAYRAPKDDVPVEFLVIDFYQVGAHENFYAELKQYLRQEKSKGTSK